MKLFFISLTLFRLMLVFNPLYPPITGKVEIENFHAADISIRSVLYKQLLDEVGSVQ